MDPSFIDQCIFHFEISIFARLLRFKLYKSVLQGITGFPISDHITTSYDPKTRKNYNDCCNSDRSFSRKFGLDPSGPNVLMQRLVRQCGTYYDRPASTNKGPPSCSAAIFCSVLSNIHHLVCNAHQGRS